MVWRVHRLVEGWCKSCCFCAALSQLAVRSSVFTLLDLDVVDVTLKYAGSVLPGGKSGSADGWWCCRVAPGRPLHLPPATFKNPPPFIASRLLFCFRGDGPTSTASGRLEVNLLLSEKQGGKSHFGKILVSAVLGI